MLLLALALVWPGRNLVAEDSEPNLADLKIEDLLNLEVTSVAKKQQKLAAAPAAVFVITREDIRRSTARSIPELLRIVPGLEVARIDSRTWAISARGFNGRYANKLLVLIDGRSVYTPLFSGVYWDSLDVVLDDIERIEVIRGPGAVMWGANAVNGVINITTKSARDTRGTLLTAEGGTLDQGAGAVRQGGQLGQAGAYRIWAKYRGIGSSQWVGGGSALEGWDDLRGGFRTDWRNTRGDAFTVQGDTYRSNGAHLMGMTPATRMLTGPSGLQPVRSSGGNVLARWKRDDGASSTAVQIYYDRFDRTEDELNEMRGTFDLDFQHDFARRGRHQLMVGGGYRVTADSVRTQPGIKLDPSQDSNSLWSAFFNDDVQLLRDRLVLSVGSKFEHNHYTGLEVQPGVRLEFSINPRQSLWAAVSRAVRLPSRRDRDLTSLEIGTYPLTPSIPVYVIIEGNKQHRSEALVAHELGYRVQAARRLTLDFAGFFNRYTHVQADLGGAPVIRQPMPPIIVLPTTLETALSMTSFGAELSASWTVTPVWKLAGGYSWLNTKWGDMGRLPYVPLAMHTDPKHQYNMRSYLDLPGGLSLDVSASYTGNVMPYNGTQPVFVPAYFRSSAQLSRRFMNGLEIGVGGDNLNQARHIEYHPEAFGQGALIGRSAYVRIGWRSHE